MPRSLKEIRMDTAKVRKRLKEERSRLEAVRSSLEEESRGGGTPQNGAGELGVVDQQLVEPGSETFEREKHLSIMESVDAAIAEIDRAEQRLRDGTYGTCEACGRPIGEARLTARPAARYCVEDQARAEREARAG
jgi:RNA polymerase-binding transcription factor DksA